MANSTTEKQINIIFRIINQGKGGAEQVVRDIKNIEANFQKAETEAKKFGASLKKAETDAYKMASAMKNAEAKKFAASLKQAETEAYKMAAAMKKASLEAKKFGSQFKNDMREAGFSVMQVGVALAGLGVATVGTFALAVKVAADFEASMDAVLVISGATKAEFALLSEEARKMGRETRFSATEAAEGLRFLSMAGFSARESLVALPGVLNLAIAGSMELAKAADIATNVMTAYGFAAEDLEMINDRLTTAFTNSNSTLLELGEAFKYVGPIAKGVGGDFDDLVSALGMLHNSGIKGSMAGMTLRQTLDALFNPTKMEADMLATLSERIGGVGIQLKDQKGNFVGFESLVRQLEQSGIEAGEALRLFGTRAGPGMVALMLQGADALHDFNILMAESGGSSKRIAVAMDANLKGAVKRLTSALSGLAEQIGSYFLPALAWLFDSLAKLLNIITILFDAVGPIGVWIIGTIAALGALALAVGTVTVAFQTFVAPALAAYAVIAGLGAGASISAIAFAGFAAAVRGATAAVVGFLAMIPVVGWVLLGIGAALATITVMYSRFRNETKENIKAHREEASALQTAGAAYQRYQEDIKGLPQYSEKVLEANKKLKASFKELANDPERSAALRKAATDAYESIDATTGIINKYSDAIERVENVRGTEMLSALEKEVIAVGQALSESTGGIGVWDHIFQRAEGMRKSWFRISSEIETAREGAKNMTEEQQKNSDALLKSSALLRTYVRDLANLGKLDLSGSQADFDKLDVFVGKLEEAKKGGNVMAAGLMEAYVAIVEQNKKTEKIVTTDSEFEQTKRHRKLVDNYKQYVKDIQLNAQGLIVKVQQDASVLLANSNSTAKERVLIEEKAALEISRIEREKFNNIYDLSVEHWRSVEALTPSADKDIEEANAIAIKALHNKKTAEIETLGVVSEAERTAAARKLAEGERIYALQQSKVKALSQEAIAVLEDEFADRRLSTEGYWDSVRSLTKQAQDEEIEGLKTIRDLEKNDPDRKEEINTEIKNKEIANERILLEIEKKRIEAVKAIEKAEKELGEELERMKLLAASEDPGAGVLKRLEARFKLEADALKKAQQDKLELYGKAKVDEEELDKLRDQQKKDRDQKEVKQFEEKLKVMLDLSQQFTTQALGTFSSFYDMRREQHKGEEETLKQTLDNEIVEMRNAEAERTTMVNRELIEMMNAGATQEEIERKQTESKIQNAMVDDKVAEKQRENEKKMMLEKQKNMDKDLKLFKIKQTLAVAQAIINTSLAVTGAYKENPNALGIVMAALIMAQGFVQVAMISQQTMADGGFVKGSSPSDRADNIPVMLTANEFVLPVAAGRKYGSTILNAMRTGVMPKDILSNALGSAAGSVPLASPSFHLAAGGPVPDMPEGKGGKTGSQNVSIVNLLDPSLFSQYTSSDEGKQAIVNVISDKSYEINYVLNQ